MELQQKTILLVEDEPFISMAEARKITRFGYQVLTAGSGEEALELFSRRPEIDLVLMDIDLGPGMDGTQAAREILHQRSLPIVFLTSHSEREMVEKVRHITRYGYVLKHGGDFVLQTSIEMAFELFEAHQEILHSEQKYRTVADFTHDWEYWRDPHGQFLYISPSVEHTTGYTVQDFQSNPDLLTAIIYPDDKPRTVNHFSVMETPESDEPSEIEFRILTSSGEVRWMGHVCAAVYGARGEYLGCRGSNRDITDRKLSELRVAQLSRLYATLSQVNQAISHSKTTDELYQSICQIAIAGGGFHLAWVGLLDKLDGRVIPVASAGDHTGFVDSLGVNIRSELTGRGPTGRALHSGQIVFSSDIRDEPQQQMWRGLALQRGFRSSVAVPFRQQGETVGALNLYISTPGFFQQPEELSLLEEIGADISLALDATAAEAERRNSEALQRNILDSLSAHIAVLDQEGVIVAVNRAWMEFSRQNCGCEKSIGLGVNYLETCKKAVNQDPDQYAQQALQGIRSVLDGQQDLFEMEYSCHAPHEARWFMMRVTHISGGRPGVVVTHEAITNRKLAEMARQANEERVHSTLRDHPAAG